MKEERRVNKDVRLVG
jgi:hypothetical protein